MAALTAELSVWTLDKLFYSLNPPPAPAPDSPAAIKILNDHLNGFVFKTVLHNKLRFYAELKTEQAMKNGKQQ